MRRAFLAHQDGARLCAIAAPSLDAEEAAARISSPLVAAGLERQTALSYQASVISLALGWAVYQQSEAFHDYLAAMIGIDESFEAGLQAMVNGFPDAKDQASGSKRKTRSPSGRRPRAKAK